MKKLRAYQEEAVCKLLANNRNILRQNFTGTGKSVEIHAVVESLLKENKTVFVVVPKDYLLEDFLRYFTVHKYKPGVIKSGKTTIWSQDKKLYLCTIQTLYRRLNALHILPDVVIFDECHNLRATTFEEVTNFFLNKKIRLLGWTATPVRLDGKGFDEIFTDLVISHPYRWFIKNHYLSEYVIPDINQYTKDFKITKGEYDLKEQEEYYNQPTILIDAVDCWLQYCKGQKTVVFCTSIEHSKQVVQKYNEIGKKLYGRTIAVHIDKNTSKEERAYIFKRLSNDNDLLIISNFNLISEGLNIPSVSVTQWLRVTKSETLYDQGNGRSNRYEPGKIQYILDHVGNIGIHNLPCRLRNYTLKGRKKIETEDKDTLKCSLCQKILVREISKKRTYQLQSFMCPDCELDSYLLPISSKKVKQRDFIKKYKEDIQPVSGFMDLTNIHEIHLKEICKKILKTSKKSNLWKRLKGYNLTIEDYKYIAKLYNFSEGEALAGFSQRFS